MLRNIIIRLDSLFIGRGIFNIICDLLDCIGFNLFFNFYYKARFKHYGHNVKWGRDFKRRIIPSSVRISCPERISIGDNVKIDDGVYLQCDSNSSDSEILIGNNSRINAHSHILSGNRILLEEEVLVAPFVLIASNNHRYDLNESIMNQGMKPSGEIQIGNGAWIGQGACILGGTKVDKQAVVGAGVKVSKQVVSKKAKN